MEGTYSPYEQMILHHTPCGGVMFENFLEVPDAGKNKHAPEWRMFFNNN
jgi:hypothetical protein